MSSLLRANETQNEEVLELRIDIYKVQGIITKALVYNTAGCDDEKLLGNPLHTPRLAYATLQTWRPSRPGSISQVLGESTTN